MKMNFLLIIIILLSNYRIALSVNQNNNWFFGYNAGITLNTIDGDPIALDSSSMFNFEGCSAISDKNGDLLFYTDGIYIFNKYHKIINSKDSLLNSHLSSTQSSLIVPIPNSDNKYYIFTTDAGEYYQFEDGSYHINRGLNYSKISVLDDNIKIDSLNINLLKKSTEKITATKHANNMDYWVVSRGWDNDEFNIYLITKDGLIEIISQSIGNITSKNWRESIGYMKFSADSRYLAFVNEGRDYFELFKFDNKLGKFSEPLIISTSGRFYNYGLEFSTSGKYIFISESKNGEIFRYDISSYDIGEIVKSETKIYKESKEEVFIGALQIAPNEKIYFSRYKFKFLGEIANTDSIDCNVNQDAVYLGNDTDGYGAYGLPNMIQSNNKFKVNLKDTTVCQNSNLEIIPNINFLIDYITFEWTGPNNFKSTDFSISFTNIDLINQGKYYLKTTYGDKILLDSIEIKVKESPKAEIEGPNHICGNVPIFLNSKYNNYDYQYLWNNGQSTQTIEVKEAGTYILEVRNTNNCIDYDTLIVSGSIINTSFSKTEINDLICPAEKLIENICIKNNENNEIELVNITSKNPNIKIEKVDNIKILGEKSFCFDIEIYSETPIIINDSIKFRFKSKDCEMDYFIKINCSIELNTKIEISNYEKSPGDYFCIDLPLTNLCNNYPSFKSNYETVISYNAEYFYIDTILNGIQIDKKIIDTTTYLTLKSNEIDFSKDIQNISICGMVMTGGHINSPIKIETIDWENELINTHKINGSLKIVSCAINIRPIKFYKPSQLTSYQNSENDWIIKYESQLPGNHNISLINLSGEIVSEFNFHNLDENELNKEIMIESSHLVTGLYIILIKNPFYSTFFKQIILK